MGLAWSGLVVILGVHTDKEFYKKGQCCMSNKTFISSNIQLDADV